MKFPKMVKHLLAGEKITRDRWIRDNLGYIVRKDDRIVSIVKGGNPDGVVIGHIAKSCMFNANMKWKGWRVYNESD